MIRAFAAARVTGLPLNVVCHGNSLTYGYQLPPSPAPPVQSASNYPAVLDGIRPAGDIITNAGTTGWTTSQLISEFDSVVQPLRSSTKANVVVFWEGINSLANGTTASAEWQLHKDYADHARGLFWDVLILNVLPQNAVNPPTDAVRLAFNALLAADHSFALRLLDVAGDSFYASPSSDPPYMPDQIHLRDSGYSRIATTHVGPALAEIYP